jgi:ADP-ribose pyrophosphatase YjhB (NUDIX family)
MLAVASKLPAMTLPRIFVGSSRESLHLARGIKANLEEIAEVRVWDEDLFAPGSYPLDELLRFTTSFDFAILVCSGDDVTSSRGTSIASPRDNVMLEAGMFYGSLGRARVFLVTPRAEPVKTPSDLLGVAVVTYAEPSDGNYRAATSSACTRLAEQIKRIGNARSREPEESIAPMCEIYQDFGAAKSDITAACKNASEIQLLSNKGLALFGLDESLISVEDVTEYAQLRSLRLLLIDPGSPWINQGHASLRHYESVENYRKNLSASHSIVESSLERFRSQLELARCEIRYHSVRPAFRVVMTESVAFIASYADNPSTQVRDLAVFRYVNEPGSLYQAYKRLFYDLWEREAKPARTAHAPEAVEISAGGIVFTRDESIDYIALVQRDDGSWALPKGHRRQSTENLATAALREVSEELGLSGADVVVERSLDDYAYDESIDRSAVAKVTYIYVMRYMPGGRPALSPDADHRQATWWPVTQTLPFLRYAYQRTLIAETVEQAFDVSATFEA